MILVNSGAFLSIISSWFCELTELIFVMIPYISSTGYPPKTQGIMGHVQVANSGERIQKYPGSLQNSPDACGKKPYSERKSCEFKNVRIRVND